MFKRRDPDAPKPVPSEKIVSFLDDDGILCVITNRDENLEHFAYRPWYDEYMSFRYKDDDYTVIIPRHRIVKCRTNVRKGFFVNELEE